MSFEVRTDSLAGTATALGWARGHTDTLRQGVTVRLSDARVHGADAAPAGQGEETDG